MPMCPGNQCILGALPSGCRRTGPKIKSVAAPARCVSLSRAAISISSFCHPFPPTPPRRLRAAPAAAIPSSLLHLTIPNHLLLLLYIWLAMFVRPSWTETERDRDKRPDNDFICCLRENANLIERLACAGRKHTTLSGTGAAGDTRIEQRASYLGIISVCFSGWPRVNDDDAMMGMRRRVNYLACLL